MCEQRRDNGALWNKSYIIVFITGICTAMSSFMITPLISKFALSLGTSLTAAGSVASVMSIAALVCRPFTGVISDTFNRKRLTVASTLLAALMAFACAFATAVPALVAIRAVHGVAFSFMTVANMALASAFIPNSRLGEGMGYLGVGSILASAVGPGLGLWVSERFGYNFCFYLSAGFMLAGALTIMLAPYRHEPKSAGGGRVFRIRGLFAGELTLYVLILALLSCGNGLISTYLALLGDERGIANIALFFTVFSLTLVLIRPFIGVLLDKRGLAVILYPALFITSVSMLLVGAASVLWILLPAAVLKALGQGAATPSIHAHTIKLLGKERAGVAVSTCYIGQDIGNGVAPILGGVAATSYGYNGMFFGYAVILLVFGTLFFAVQRRKEKREETSART